MKNLLIRALRRLLVFLIAIPATALWVALVFAIEFPFALLIFLYRRLAWLGRALTAVGRIYRSLWKLDFEDARVEFLAFGLVEQHRQRHPQGLPL